MPFRFVIPLLVVALPLAPLVYGAGDDDATPAPKSVKARPRKKPVQKSDDTEAADPPKHPKGAGKKAGAKDEDSPSPPEHSAAKKTPLSTPEPSASAPAAKTHRHAEGEEAPGKSSGKAKAADDRTTTDAKPDQAPAPQVPEHAPAATLAPSELMEFASLPERTQKLITSALELTKLNLTYTFGSSDPSSGGMDCSGTIHYVLRANGLGEVPRDSSEQYAWVRKNGQFFAVVGASAESFEFSDLRPGDLLFWTGTYQTHRELPISHVMLYLGKEKKTQKRVMFGASDGRSYHGVQRWGVSVFDFKMPRNDVDTSGKEQPRFVGYGRIPGLRETPDERTASVAPPPKVAPEPEPENPESAEPKTTRPKPKHRSGKSATPRPKE